MDTNKRTEEASSIPKNVGGAQNSDSIEVVRKMVFYRSLVPGQK